MTTLRIAVALGVVAPAFAACASQSPSRDDLKSLLRAQVERCYKIPTSAKGDPSVTLEFRLKADGTLAQAPVVVTGDANSAIARSAIDSLNRCVPFAIPSSVAARLPDGLPMRVEFNSR